jgi:hypothetical protein
VEAEMDKFLKGILAKVETIKLRWLIVGAIAALVIFASMYMVGATYGWGLKQGTEPVTDFWSCLYFSIVTFTSLGFGDLRPVGYGRMLASLEVIVGLTVFGLAVAKLSSYKQSYLLNQLYARDVQSKLDQFALNLRAHRFSCKQFSNLLRTKGTPAHGAGELIEEIKTEVTRIRAYVSFESRNGYMLSGTPIGSITRLLKAFSTLIPRVVALSCIRHTRVSQKYRASAKEFVSLAAAIGVHLSEAPNESVRSEVRTLNRRCDSALVELAAVSEQVRLNLEEMEREKRKAYQIQASQSGTPEEL